MIDNQTKSDKIIADYDQKKLQKDDSSSEYDESGKQHMKKIKGTLILLVFLTVLAVTVNASASDAEGIFQPDDLPVIYLEISGGQAEIDRMNSSPDHSYRCTGTMSVIMPSGYTGIQENIRNLPIDYIRGRGNGTWNMSKNPYKIKLEEKTDLFGMGKSKTWVLLANYFDGSLIRNHLAAWLGESVGLEYTPQGVFAEVVMNGEYLGNYYLCEQIQVNKNRVAIDELKEEDTSTPDIQGGYLMEFCPDDYDSPSYFETSRGLMLGNINPSFDPDEDDFVSDEQKEYIRGYIQKAEDAIYADGTEYTEYLDLQSLADYWWIMEFTVNEDAFRTDSAHMFKPRFEADGSEGKLHFGPLWDFDASMGNGQYETATEKGFNNTTFIWVDELRKKPEFIEILRERWQVLNEKLERMVSEGGMLDRTAAEIRNSWYRDDAKWHASKEECGFEVLRNIEDETGHIRNWINLRRQWISENLDKLNVLTYTVTFRTEGGEDLVYNVPSFIGLDPYEYTMDELTGEGKQITGWALEDGTVTEYFTVEQDTVLTAVYDDQ